MNPLSHFAMLLVGIFLVALSLATWPKKVAPLVQEQVQADNPPNFTLPADCKKVEVELQAGELSIFSHAYMKHPNINGTTVVLRGERRIEIRCFKDEISYDKKKADSSFVISGGDSRP